jgi:hypothetical protein
MPNSDRIDRGVELEFVKDGFSWLTALFPLLGFLANRLWLIAGGYLVAVSLLIWALTALKIDQQWIGIIFLMLNIFLGLEISTLKRWMLEQKGWQTLGVVNGRSIADCERRFFEGWLANQPIIAAGATDTVDRSAPAARGGFRFWPFGSGG